MTRWFGAGHSTLTDPAAAGAAAAEAAFEGREPVIAVVGVILNDTAGKALVGAACGSMLAAALVLLATNRRMLRAAAVQGLAPLIALVSLFF